MNWLSMLRACAVPLFFSSNLFADSPPISLNEVLQRAVARYPTLTAARARESSAAEAISIAKSAYYPTLDAEAIYSSGFPGSSGAVGVTGLMGSPYRSGVAGGLVLRQNIWDFGRTSSGILAAKEDLEERKEESKLTRYELYKEATNVFYECSRFQSQLSAWKAIESEARTVEKEIQKFVQTGQRSTVDRYLASSQAEEAAQAIAGYEARLRAIVHRLSLVTGSAEDEIICPHLPQRRTQERSHEPVGENNPYVRRAEKEYDVAQARLSQARAGHLPRLIGVASVGDMQRSRLVNEQNYALGVGLVIPIFDGWRTTGEVERASAVEREKKSEVAVTKQRLSEWNSKYDELIESSRARLEHLERELDLVQKGFSLAKERYFSFRGALIDLREALRNLSRAETQANDLWADFLEAEAGKAFINGRTPPSLTIDK